MASDAWARAYFGSRPEARWKSSMAWCSCGAPRRLKSTLPWRKSDSASGSDVSARAGAAGERPSVPSRVAATVRAISSCTANTFASGRSYFSVHRTAPSPAETSATVIRTWPSARCTVPVRSEVTPSSLAMARWSRPLSWSEAALTRPITRTPFWERARVISSARPMPK